MNVLTYSNFELVLEELEADERGGEEGDVGTRHTLPKEAEISVQRTHAIRTSGSLEAALGLLVPLVHPVQGEPVEKRRVLIATAHAYELPLPILVGLLEDRKNGPPGDPIKADP